MTEKLNDLVEGLRDFAGVCWCAVADVDKCEWCRHIEKFHADLTTNFIILSKDWVKANAVYVKEMCCDLEGCNYTRHKKIKAVLLEDLK